MTDFKVGDKVRYKGGDGLTTWSNADYIGIEGEVITSSGGNYGYTVKITKIPETATTGFNIGNIFSPRGTNLELIEDEPFKVGDRVEAAENFWTIKKGTRLRINSVERTQLGNERFHGGKYLIGVVSDDGTADTVFDFRIKKVEEDKEPVFKVGDKVIVKGWEHGENPSWEGRTGTVTHSSWTVSVKFDDRPDGTLFSEGSFAPRYLEHVKPFTFDDIKVGDKVKRTRSWPDGTEEITIGVVDTKGRLTSYSKEDVPLAYSTDDTRDYVTVELLERPEPKPEPKIWENRKKGDKVVREDEDGILTVFTKEDGDEWSSIYLNNTQKNKAPAPGYDWDSTDIMDALADDYTLTLIKA